MNEAIVAVPPVGIISQQEDMYHRIRRACKRWGQDSEDVAHTAWLKAQKLGYFTSDTILQAARDLGIFRETEIPPDMPADTPTCGAVVDVRRALGQLSPKARALIHMYHFRGDTIPEIAATTGDNIGMIHARLREAEDALRRMLIDYAPRPRHKPKPDADLPLFGGGVR